jgi:hypothetical protein
MSEWSTSRPGRALSLGKESPAPIVQEAGRATEPVWTQRLGEKSFCLCRGSNLDRPVVQPTAKHYTDWATRLTKYDYRLNNNGQIKIGGHSSFWAWVHKTLQLLHLWDVLVRKQVLLQSIPDLSVIQIHMAVPNVNT